jgi:hypothetical protein
VSPDSGYAEDLPFNGSGDGAKASAHSGDDSVAALGGQRLASSKDESRPTSLLFLAAGLLATVVLMHLLWLRDEVNRDAPPAISPEDPATP